MVQWEGLCTSTAGGKGLVPGQGTEIPQIMWYSQKEKHFQKKRNKSTFIFIRHLIFKTKIIKKVIGQVLYLYTHTHTHTNWLIGQVLYLYTHTHTHTQTG